MDKNLVIILLVLSLFMGATIQYTYGSTLAGVLLFVLAIILLSRMDIKRAPGDIKPRFYAVIGILIITFDAAYNYASLGRSGLNTLDSMVLLLGASLVARSIGIEQLRMVGAFGMYMSASFIALYVTFYILLGDFLYNFDHYFVMLPSAYLAKLAGVPIEIVARETIQIIGTNTNLILKIGGPCSGLYSMFLLIGIVVGYSMTEGVGDMRKIAKMAGVAAIVAYSANLIRVSILYVTGYLFGIDTMMAVHVHVGWILFAVTSIFLLSLLRRI